VFALAGPVVRERVAQGAEVLREAGFEVVPAANLYARHGYLAGGDEERLDGLHGLLDAGVDALIAARGGFGITRLLPLLPWRRLAEWGGWVVGFSDVTALHAGLAARFPRATLHGPMVSTLARHAPSTRKLLGWLGGNPSRVLFRTTDRQVLRGGAVRGVAAGGTLSILAALEATEYAWDCEGAVVFIEEVGEPLYRLDRLLTQLKQTSRLAHAKAIVGGRLPRCGAGEPGWRERWRELLLEVAPPGAVVLDGLPFGHGRVNVPVPMGVEVAIDTTRGVVRWGGS
jgi:muramoyltetrapeptide carboxypeptidase